MRLVSWNVAGRVTRLAEQVETVGASGAEVVCLQEITPSTLRPWREGLADIGYPHVLTSIDDWLPGEPSPEGRRLGVLTASRSGPIEPVAPAHVPWPERLLSVRLEAEPPLEVHNLHSPTSAKPGHVKVRTHDALFAELARKSMTASVLCGDLNTPSRELETGEVWTFARTASGKLRLDRGERWDSAELALIKGLEEHGWRDAFRSLHGYGERVVSWTYPRRRNGHRLDHVIVSPQVEVLACDYVHAARELGLSDHSLMWAELVAQTS